MDPDQFVKHLQPDLHNYFRAALSALAALVTATRTQRGQLGGSVYTAVTGINEGLTALIESVKGLCSPSASVN